MREYILISRIRTHTQSQKLFFIVITILNYTFAAICMQYHFAEERRPRAFPRRIHGYFAIEFKDRTRAGQGQNAVQHGIPRGNCNSSHIPFA